MTVVVFDAHRAARKPRLAARWRAERTPGSTVVAFPEATRAAASQTIGAIGAEARARAPAVWLARLRRRRLLRGMLSTEPVSVLQDLGYRDRGDARIEANKPFWRA